MILLPLETWIEERKQQGKKTLQINWFSHNFPWNIHEQNFPSKIWNNIYIVRHQGYCVLEMVHICIIWVGLILKHFQNIAAHCCGNIPIWPLLKILTHEFLAQFCFINIPKFGLISYWIICSGRYEGTLIQLQIYIAAPRLSFWRLVFYSYFSFHQINSLAEVKQNSIFSQAFARKGAGQGRAARLVSVQIHSRSQLNSTHSPNPLIP